MLKKSVALLLACLVLLSTLSFAVSAEVQPNNALVAATESAVAESVGKDTPGAGVILFENGSLLMREGFGYADIGNGEDGSRVPVVSESVFEIGRLSGIFVAIAAYRLAEEGKLDLNASIAQYLPDEFMKKLALKDKVSVHQLLSGTAGFGGRTFDLAFDSDFYCFATLEDALLAEVPQQIAEPDDYYSYSAFGITLAAFVVEAITGQSYDSYVKANILTPLGMENTFLFATEDTEIKDPVKGHITAEEGIFSVAPHNGRTYFGLYPADGALSCLVDLSLLVEFLLTGKGAILTDASRTAMLSATETESLFKASSPALTVKGNAVGVDTATRYFSTSLWLDLANGKGALVVANVADCKLLSLSATLCNAKVGTAVEPSEEFLNVKDLEGTYAPAASERTSFVGRLWRKDNALKLSANEDGTITFRDRRYAQVATGIFVDVDDTTNTAVLQILREDGKISTVITADGESFVPLAFYEHGIVATVLFYLLIAAAVWFLVGSVVAFLCWRAGRKKEDNQEGFRHVLPDLISALISVLVLVQVLVAVNIGSAAIASFFNVMGLLVLIVGIGALVAHSFSIITSLTNGKIFGREIRTAMIFLVYVFLIFFWGLVLF